MKLHPAAPTEDVGIIVGRFQVPYLHKGHMDLINTVRRNHQKIIIFLGSRPGILGSRNNPLDYPTREQMIKNSKRGRFTDSMLETVFVNGSLERKMNWNTVVENAK